MNLEFDTFGPTVSKRMSLLVTLVGTDARIATPQLIWTLRCEFKDADQIGHLPKAKKFKYAKHFTVI